MAPPEWARYTHALPSIASAVGRTPLVRLNRITADVTPALYVKIEWYGATGSLKDRIYLHMFERAEARGDPRRESVALLGAGAVRQSRQHRGAHADHRPRGVGADGGQGRRLRRLPGLGRPPHGSGAL